MTQESLILAAAAADLDQAQKRLLDAQGDLARCIGDVAARLAAELRELASDPAQRAIDLPRVVVE